MLSMIRFSFPSDSGNTIVSSGKINEVFGNLLQDLKPEAAYFYPQSAERGGVLFVNAGDSAEIAALVEPFWLALNAKVEFTPVMSADDLMKGLAGMPALASRYQS